MNAAASTKNTHHRAACKLFAFALYALVIPAESAAEVYPSRPIKLIIPFPAGSSSDLIGRTIARKIGESAGQPVIVDNRAGASGVIGQEALSRSPPDGYTIGLGTVSTLAMAPSVHASLPYHPLESFVPIGLVARGSFLVVVHPSVSAKSLNELSNLARTVPGGLNFYSIGHGTLHHFAGEQFNALTATQLVHVPYKGAAHALPGLLAGDVHVGFDLLSSFRVQNIETGRLRALAVAGPARLPQLPSVPTAAEAGLPGFEMTAWFGLVAPQGTPADVVARLRVEVQKAIASVEAKQVFAAQGLDPAFDPPEEFSGFIGSEMLKWAAIVKDSGFKPK